MASPPRSPRRVGLDDAVTPAEAQLLRRVRVNLTLWSAGVTLAVLIVLGAILYVAVDRSLTASGTAQLVAQANAITGGRRDPGGDPPPGGLIFGGPNSGTFTMVVRDDGQPGRPRSGPARLAGHGVGRGRQGERGAGHPVGDDHVDRGHGRVDRRGAGRRRPARTYSRPS